MTDKQLLEQALEALLDSIDDVRDCLNQNLPHAGYARYDRRIEAYREQIKKHEKAIADLTAAIRARLEQPEQEPLGYQYQDGYGNWCNFLGEKHYKDTLASGNFAIRPIYTTPPAAPVQELVAWMHKETGLLRQANKAKGGDFEPNHWTPLYTAIEQALAAPYVASQLVQEPVATLIDHYGFTDGVVRFDGVENMEQLPIGTKFYIAPLNVATPLAAPVQEKSE